MRRDREILERAVRVVSEQVATPGALVDEAVDTGLGSSHPLTVHAKMLRLELLQVKADLERELGQLVLDCSDCGRTVHWVAGLGSSRGHWAHREPAPHSGPVSNVLAEIHDGIRKGHHPEAGPPTDDGRGVSPSRDRKRTSADQAHCIVGESDSCLERSCERPT